MAVDMETRLLENGWMTTNTQVDGGILYAIQHEVALYGVAWFSTSVQGAGDLETQVVPTGRVRTKQIATSDEGP